MSEVAIKSGLKQSVSITRTSELKHTMKGAAEYAGQMVSSLADKASNNDLIIPKSGVEEAVAPLIVRDPISIALADGDKLSLLASAADYVSVKWQKNVVDVGGATSEKFEIASVVVGDAGSFTAIFTNAAGSTTTAAAVVTVT